MGVQGLDRAEAPSAAMAKRMLDEIGGRWWNVYIGGPESGGHGWTPALVADYVRHGIDRFMLTYVGRQSHGPLTRGQGQADALDALGIAQAYGYSGSFPLCLDVELHTFESAPSKTVEYARAWCASVHDAGVRPGVYANAVPLRAMAKGKVPADFVWVASWVSHGATQHDPHAIPNLPAELWSEPGARAWQYAGAFDGKSCRVLGLDVDISVADPGCLAAAPGLEPGAAAAGRRRPLRRGDEGVRVERLTRRLAYVHARATRAPYLDGVRRRFDRETEAALMEFQREHGLVDDGRFGTLTAEKLRRAVAREKERRREQDGAVPPDRSGATMPMATARRDLASLVERAIRTDRRNDEALEDLLAYGLRRRRQLKRLQERHAGSTEALLSEIVQILLRIEDDVEELRKDEEREPAVAVAAEKVVEVPTGAGSETTSVPYTVAQMEPQRNPQDGPGSRLPPEANGNAAADTSAAALADLPDRAIAGLIREHDAAIDVARGVLVERFKRYDAELARLRPPGAGGRPSAGGKPGAPAGGGGSSGAPAGGGGGVPVGGSVADIRLGDQAHIVRASKIALARLLAAKGNHEHAALRRALKREARTRKRGEIATRTWEQAVRAAQHLTASPVTGILDGELRHQLAPYWPTDSALRLMLRATPAWRLIKGQLSPNFNIREFACKDGTPYIQGLVREQGLTEQQAKQRAHELAKRLERVRTAGGDRALTLTSVYRTIAHNARQPGAVPNSSHLRGYAADIQPPTGITLQSHRQHVRAAFEAGVGYYPPPHGNFVHGDMDTKLGRRDWTA